LQTALLCAVAWCLLNPISLQAQNAFEATLAQRLDSLLNTVPVTVQTSTELYPNDALQSVMTPTGWGGYGTYVFGGIGGAYPEVYRRNKADLITYAGVTTGDFTKFVNAATSLNMTDVHKFRNFSANFVLSRKLFKGTSVSIGGLQLFANKKQSDASGSTFYIAFSHAVQTLASQTPGGSKLSYTIGIGTGRFLYKSPKDIGAGRGKYGTAVFGNISYEIFKHANLNAEWSGMNLGFSFGVRPFKNPLSFGIGIANLTRYSADKPGAVFSIGYPLSIKR